MTVDKAKIPKPPVRTDAPGEEVAPKRRGRPPKNHDGQVAPPARQCRKRKTSEPVQEDDGPAVKGLGKPAPLVPPEHVPENPANPSWPTRATFAGRHKGGDQSGEVFEKRRKDFYQNVPQKYWKDSLERDYWRLCVENDGDTHLGVQKFMMKMEPNKSTAKVKAQVS